MYYVAAEYASSASGYVITGLVSLTVLMLAWVAKVLARITADLRLLNHEVLPENEPSLSDQVGDIRTKVAVLQVGGSGPLQEIVAEQRRVRGELERLRRRDR